MLSIPQTRPKHQGWGFFEGWCCLEHFSAITVCASPPVNNLEESWRPGRVLLSYSIPGSEVEGWFYGLVGKVHVSPKISRWPTWACSPSAQGQGEPHLMCVPGYSKDWRLCRTHRDTLVHAPSSLRSEVVIGQKCLEVCLKKKRWGVRKCRQTGRKKLWKIALTAEGEKHPRHLKEMLCIK